MATISYDTKQKLKDIFLYFEPYAAFKRIDRESSGEIGCKALSHYLRENGFREITKDDVQYMIRYFDQNGDLKLTFHDFLQILLPCDDAVLRAAATQRPTYYLGKNDFLPMRIEKTLTNLLVKEVKMQMKAENLKRILESSYDFQVLTTFKAVDDWNYNYIDEKNLRRFLRNMGCLASKQELVAMIRRFDTDGDAKINIEEFEEGIRSQFSLTNQFGAKLKVKNPSASFMNKSFSRSDIRNQSNPKSRQNISIPSTPNKSSASKTRLTKSKKKKRPQSASKSSAYTGSRYRNEVLNQLYGDEQKMRSYMADRSPDDSASKLNKSVTFNNQVRVREYNNQLLEAQNQINPQQNPMKYNEKEFLTPSKELIKQFDQILYDQKQTPSPLRDINAVNHQRNNQELLVQQPLNFKNTSPLRNSNLKYSDNKIGSPLNMSNQSPLRTQSPLGRSNLNTSEDKLRISPYKGGQEDVNFDRIEKGEMAKVFKDSIFLERELESAKIELALKADFNLLDSFRIIDPLKKGYFTAQDLNDYLQRNLQCDFISKEDAYLFFRRYDINQNGKMTFHEYSNAVLPLSKEYAQLVTGRQEFFSLKDIHPADYFNIETRLELKNMWRTFFHIERANECIRVRIAKRPQFKINTAFAYSDRDQNGVLTAMDIRDMLSEHGFFATEKELNFLMNKFDRDQDQKITYAEFIEEMTPKLSI